jgi:hypothetical protein
VVCVTWIRRMVIGMIGVGVAMVPRHFHRKANGFAAIVAMAALVVTGGVLASPAQAADVPSPSVNYTFGGNLTDSGGGSTLSLMPACPDPVLDASDNQCNLTTGFGTDANGSYWTWTAEPGFRGGGFDIETNNPLTSTYSMEIKFVFDSVPEDGYVKIIDYQGKVSDDGFYFNDQLIDFYAGDPYDGTTQYPQGTVLDLVATRDNVTSLFSVYAKSASGALEQVFQYSDVGGDAIPIDSGTGSLIGFFFDDNDTDDEATTGGRVYSVKMWEGVALTPQQINDLVDPGRSTGESPSPPPWLQQIGRASDSAQCPTGWNPSWAQWATPYTGGWVCNRAIYWLRGTWYMSPDAGWIANGDPGVPWTGPTQ